LEKQTQSDSYILKQILSFIIISQQNIENRNRFFLKKIDFKHPTYIKEKNIWFVFYTNIAALGIKISRQLIELKLMMSLNQN
jgi:hypothetical protein